MDVRRLKVNELREELQRRGLDTRGLKAELAERLLAALEAEEPEEERELDADGGDGGDGDGDGGGRHGGDGEPGLPERRHDDEVDTEGGSELEGTAPPPPPGLQPHPHPHPEPGGYPGPDGHYVMDNITRQNQFYETPVIKQENESGYDRRPLDMEPQQPAYRPELKTEMKQEAPPSFLPPEASQLKPDRQQFQSRKRPFEENRGRGYFEHREDRRGRSPQPPAEEDEDDFDDTLVAIDTYNCDLHFKVARDRSSGYPLTIEGFAYLWSGARASYGVRRGRVCFEMKINEEISVKHLPSTEPDPHVVRIGWSLDSCSTQLGEEPVSYGYGGTGKKSTNSRFENYGDKFAENDVIGCFADFECGNDVELSFTKNGKWMGIAFRIQKEALGGQALYPHVLVKNCAVEFNFGQRAEPYCSILPGFTFIQHLPLSERIRGTIGPKSKAECEILMMVGLPAAGKTTWAIKHAASNPSKKYNILGTNAIMDKMRVMGLRRQRNYAGRWDVLIQQATQCLNRLIQIAARKKRNYILDQGFGQPVHTSGLHIKDLHCLLNEEDRIRFCRTRTEQRDIGHCLGSSSWREWILSLDIQWLPGGCELTHNCVWYVESPQAEAMRKPVPLQLEDLAFISLLPFHEDSLAFFNGCFCSMDLFCFCLFHKPDQFGRKWMPDLLYCSSRRVVVKHPKLWSLTHGKEGFQVGDKFQMAEYSGSTDT